MLFVVLGLIAACGGGGGADTTAEAGNGSVDEQPNTTAATTATTAADAGSVSDLSDMPDECVDALVEYLQAIEPSLEGVDFQNANSDEVDAIFADLQSVTDEYEAQVDSLSCPSLDPASNEEAFAQMIEIAEREAPGTVGYLRMIEGFATSVGGDTEVSGDCETNIDAFQEYVDAGGTMSDLTMDEFTKVAALMGAISTQCSIERVNEYFSQDDVIAFTESGG
jgi:hypothetical protein